MRVHPSIIALILASAAAQPSPGQGVPPVSLDSVVALGLDSITGTAVAYFRPADRERAEELHRLLEEFLAVYRERANVVRTFRVAVLRPADWTRVTPLPYGLPNNSGTGGDLLLAATTPPDSIGARSLPRGRFMDYLVVGHEGGHLLTWAFMPDELRAFAESGDDPPPDVAQRFATLRRVPGWYWEFAANYFATAFLETQYPADARAWRTFFTSMTAGDSPRFTNLAEWYGAAMQAMASDSTPYMLTREGGRNQSWFQGVTSIAAAHVYDESGFTFVDHVRRTVRGEEAPTNAELVEEIEALAPGFKARLDRLGASYVDPPPSR
jgi:hypothetical protein